MEFAAIMVALAVFLLVSALLYNSGLKRDQREMRLRDVRGMEEKPRQKAEKSSLLQRFKAKQQQKHNAKLLSQSNDSKAKKLSPVGQMLETVGVPLTAFQFTLIKLVLAVLLFLLFDLLPPRFGLDPALSLLAGCVGMMLGIILPGRWLTSKVKAKQNGFRKALPDMMDLLVVSVEAGLGFDSALLRLYDKDKSPLMQEMMRAISDVQHGMTKKEAYGNLADRCGIKEIRSFTNALVQAEQLGISVKSVLRTQSESLREERRQKAEEKALKAPVTMLVPLVIFIFPVIFIILLGPAAMTLIELMG